MNFTEKLGLDLLILNLNEDLLSEITCHRTINKRK
jgi:hypothetical protein